MFLQLFVLMLSLFLWMFFTELAKTMLISSLHKHLNNRNVHLISKTLLDRNNSSSAALLSFLPFILLNKSTRHVSFIDNNMTEVHWKKNNLETFAGRSSSNSLKVKYGSGTLSFFCSWWSHNSSIEKNSKIQHGRE